jgi:hypothetical protein
MTIRRHRFATESAVVPAMGLCVGNGVNAEIAIRDIERRPAVTGLDDNELRPAGIVVNCPVACRVK